MDETTRHTAFVHLILSPEQQATVKERTGRDSEALRLTIAELEERIAPRAGEHLNHNESLLVEPLEDRVVPKLAANHNESVAVEPLEERIAPKIILNHNESLAIEPLEDRIAPRRL